MSTRFFIEITSIFAFHLLPSPPLNERRRYCVARRHAVCVSIYPPRRISHGGEGNALYPVLSSYLRHHLAKVLYRSASRCHAVCVCPPSRIYYASTARRNSLGGEGNALYPVLSSFIYYGCGQRLLSMYV